MPFNACHRFSRARSLCLCVILAIYLRATVNLFPYSGENTPPRFGDYEAHRYWSSVTLHVRPVSAWYEASKDHWVIDYPPLSAYLAFLVGTAAKHLGLGEAVSWPSYGYESEASRAFFRATVLFIESLVFFPAAYVASEGDLFRFSFLTLLQPCWVLIDHGHFHYTCIQLGLLLWMIAFYRTHKARALTFAALYKQTSLYLMPIPAADVFWQLMHGERPLADILWAMLLGVFVVYPFNIRTLLKRIFPFERGVFEDKVATFWCTISPALRRLGLLKSRLLPVACGVLTATAIFPFLVSGFPANANHYDRQHLCIRLTGCALSFFLFSYHVHEKHILLPLLPLSMCVREEPTVVLWTSATAVLSIFPLLLREGSGLACAILVLWMCLAMSQRPALVWMIFALPLVTLLAFNMNPLQGRYPDLLPYLTAVFCFLNFLALLVWCYIKNAEMARAPNSLDPLFKFFQFPPRLGRRSGRKPAGRSSLAQRRAKNAALASN
ncbi:hypothetical protein CCYA_CCYA13G3619 [Cyanidiococcus yangmingshanensis]|nr:hypothetical protein CCYA_CCYA13G3619 [Cyanidiococcus yangmingshanensis]